MRSWVYVSIGILIAIVILVPKYLNPPDALGPVITMAESESSPAFSEGGRWDLERATNRINNIFLRLRYPLDIAHGSLLKETVPEYILLPFLSIIAALFFSVRNFFMDLKQTINLYLKKNHLS